jgi:hypothetical protein
MDKIPIEIFVTDQLRQDRYKLIIAQIGLSEDLARLTLVTFFRDQGVNFVTSALARELSQRVAAELETKEGVSGVVRRLITGS